MKKIVLVAIILLLGFALPSKTFAADDLCGTGYIDSFGSCSSECPADPEKRTSVNGEIITCCGTWDSDTGTSCSRPGYGDNINMGQLNFGELNRTIFGQSGAPKAFTTPRGLISFLLPYLFTFAGLILFIMILWGGFEMLGGATNPKSQEAGKQRITAGIIGFLIIFAAYWLAQLLQTIFGISILG